MKFSDPKIVALLFNEHINNQNLLALSNLMSEKHRFIDRKGNIVDGKKNMIESWAKFFIMFPEYKNSFNRIESRGNLVVLYGYAKWKKDDDPDYAIWTATIENDHVAEWRIYENSEANQKFFNLGRIPEVK